MTRLFIVINCILCLLSCGDSSTKKVADLSDPDIASHDLSNSDAGTDQYIEDQSSVEPSPDFFIDGFGDITFNCPEYTLKSSKKIDATDITEASGIVASRKQPYLWVHNDSGDSARLFAINEDGEDFGAIALKSVPAVDWEDIAIGPGPDANLDYLYIGDIGDNLNFRPFVTIYRIAEPTVPKDGFDSTTDPIAAEFFTLKYPDQAHNAESLVIDPLSGDLYIFTKHSLGETQVFKAKAPLANGETRVMTYITTLYINTDSDVKADRLVTAADFAEDRSLLLLRTLNSVFGWTVEPNQSIESALKNAPCEFYSETEKQGESIAILKDGSNLDYFTLSEGSSQNLYRFTLK